MLEKFYPLFCIQKPFCNFCKKLHFFLSSLIRDISASILPFYSLERPAGRAQSELQHGAGGTFTECILSEISTMKYAHKYSLLFKKIQKFLSTLMRDISTNIRVFFNLERPGDSLGSELYNQTAGVRI